MSANLIRSVKTHCLPTLPQGAAYLHLRNAAKRNALSFDVLSDLTNELTRLNTDRSGHLLQLPSSSDKSYRSVEYLPRWLRNSEGWRKSRSHLPKVIVLRSEGPVFSSGHDLKELATMSEENCRKTFEKCAELMALIKRTPVPVVCAIQGLATAAGFQLAMCADYPIAMADTPFQLPGMLIGLPCTSPATTVSRRVPPAVAYRMYMTGESLRADQLHGAVDVVQVPEHAESTNTRKRAFEERVAHVVQKLVSLPAQPQAVGKWAFWRQHSMRDDNGLSWAGAQMVLHAGGADATEGISAFIEKREPRWKSSQDSFLVEPAQSGTETIFKSLRLPSNSEV